MKGLPPPSDFEGKGVLDMELLVENKAFFTSLADPSVNSSYIPKKKCFMNSFYSFGEPTSVLDSTISGGHTPSSTPSSSHGGGASTVTSGVGAVSDAYASPISSNAGVAESSLPSVPPFLEIGATGGLENVLSTGPPSQDQSIFRWIMGDVVEEPGNLNRAAQIGGEGVVGGGSSAPEFEFSDGLGIVDQGDPFCLNSFPVAPSFPNIKSITEKTDLPSFTHPSAFDSSSGLKPFIFNSNKLHLDQDTTNPSFFSPLHCEQAIFGPKRPDNGGTINGCLEPNWSLTDAHQQLLQQQPDPPYLHLLPHYPQPQFPSGPGPNSKMGLLDEPIQVQTMTNQLYNVAESIQTGNFLLAQEILARLNHFLSPAGKPFIRAAFYCKEALQSLLDTNKNATTDAHSPSNLVSRIAAYKLFSEISPLVEFTNFTCNQALLEAFEGLDRIHIMDFDIGLGGQWASLMQELQLRGGARPALKITAIVPPRPSGRSHLELCLVRENLFQFASQIDIDFEFEVSSIDSFRLSSNEAVGINFPICCLAEYDLPPPIVLQFVKQMSPRVVVTVGWGCEMTDLPFAGHVIHALQSCSSILESIDAVGLDLKVVQRMENFLIGPGIEKIVTSHLQWDLFTSLGFSQVGFSDFAGSLGEYVVSKACIRGFQVEKRRPSGLALCWQQQELASVSVWRC